jgi:hypothetical protein
MKRSRALIALAATFSLWYVMPAMAIDGLVAEYRFSGNADDGSIHGNNGTVTGAVLTCDRFGRADSAYEFNGTSGGIDFGNPEEFNFDTSDFSISAWFNNDSLGSVIVTKDQSGVGSLQFRLAIESRLLIFMASDSVSSTGWSGLNGYSLRSQSQVTPDHWHHAVVTRTGKRFCLYLDGSLQAVDSTATVLDFSANQVNLRAGALSGAAVFDGKIDDIRIYHVALTDSQVLELRSEGEEIITLQASQYPTYYARYRDSLVELSTITQADYDDATFRKVAGLVGDSSISLESISHPGFFLTRSLSGSSMASFAPVDTSVLSRRTASFRMVRGLVDSTKVSIESFRYQGAFLTYGLSGAMMIMNSPDPAWPQRTMFDVCVGGTAACFTTGVSREGRPTNSVGGLTRGGRTSACDMLGRSVSPLSRPQTPGLMLERGERKATKTLRVVR